MTRTRTGFLALFLVTTVGCMPAINVETVPDASLYVEPERDAITFWGHATNYIDVEGVGIITDPVFAGAYSPFHKRTIPVPPMDAFDQTEIILISHAHFDHLHPETIEQFPSGAVMLSPELAANHVGPVDTHGPRDEAR